jgi:hypothetical protein
MNIMRAVCRVASVAILVMALFLFSGIVFAGEPATVDGFIGVPWGASRQVVQKAMEERGFTLLEQRADGVRDKYRGTFTGQPAELEFHYQNDFFISGEANFLHVKGQSLDAARAYYLELKGMLTAKYGPPSQELIPYGGKTDVVSLWEELPTTATPPSQVTIQARYGQVFYGTGYLGDGGYLATGVTVWYRVPSSWANQKAVKDIKDL